MEEITSVDVRRAAMDLLARREHSRQELHYKLRRRFSAAHATELIAEALDQLAAEGLQSDTRLAEAFVRSRVGRGQGPLKIRAELRGKGVSDSAISDALDVGEIDWFEQATLAAEKRFGPDAPVDAKDRARRSRFLQQRGFSFDEISSLY